MTLHNYFLSLSKNTVVLFLHLSSLVSVFPSASCLSGTAPNRVVLQSYSLVAGAESLEIGPPPADPDQLEAQAIEDEVEQWYPTKKRYFTFSSPAVSNTDTDPHSNSSNVVMVRQTSFGCGKLGGELWESSIALCLYLLSAKDLVKGRRVLELGAGCGLPSVACRDVLEADCVLATDFWQLEADVDNFDKERLMVPSKMHGKNLQYNVEQEQGGRGQVQRLDWHDETSAFRAKASFCPELIIGSDLVYYPMDVEPLLKTLKILLEVTDRGEALPAPQPRVVLVLALRPSKREALPEFRKKLLVEFQQTHTVTMEEIDLRNTKMGDQSTFLAIQIFPK